MDPNANLAEQERILNEDSATRDRSRLKDLRFALRSWLDRGGFRPSNWSECPKASAYYYARS